MNTYNICFHGEIRKAYFPDTPLFRAMTVRSGPLLYGTQLLFVDSEDLDQTVDKDSFISPLMFSWRNNFISKITTYLDPYRGLL